ncbi:tail completion protein gp17 [Erythrobacter litoralis]|uniref:DUF3168 domain-containing protein n=1 Tax=Erythrobacter litoralis (strain HTCC2594) TaxID=314225 RepID=Q2N5Z9_ERYLH|nr:DUF3168 domain-containing protein [Erythrobacter litoralis]ABC64892.1 hypothetical protein ELI_14000 [Erythrobacter litoralis HTCC2594]
MEIQLRNALLDWLRSAPPPVGDLNVIDEDQIARATAPWLALVASMASEWGSKDRQGREIRVAFELNTRSDDPAADLARGAALESRIAALPPAQPGFRVVTNRFLRSRNERRPDNIRATLLEYRFRLLATS